MAIKYRRSFWEGKIAQFVFADYFSAFFFLFVCLCIGPCGTILRDTKECVQNKEEQNRLVIKNLKEENEKLSTHCTELLNELEKLRKQEAHWRKEKFSIDAKVKVWNENGIHAVSLNLTC